MNTENKNSIQVNTHTSPEFDYIKKLIRYRLDDYFSHKQGYEERKIDSEFDPVEDFPALDTWSLRWEKFARENDLDNRDKNGKYPGRTNLPSC